MMLSRFAAELHVPCRVCLRKYARRLSRESAVCPTGPCGTKELIDGELVMENTLQSAMSRVVLFSLLPSRCSVLSPPISLFCSLSSHLVVLFSLYTFRPGRWNLFSLKNTQRCPSSHVPRHSTAAVHRRLTAASCGRAGSGHFDRRGPRKVRRTGLSEVGGAAGHPRPAQVVEEGLPGETAAALLRVLPLPSFAKAVPSLAGASGPSHCPLPCPVCCLSSTSRWLPAAVFRSRTSTSSAGS